MTDFVIRPESDADWSNAIFLTGDLPITAEDAAALGLALGPSYEICRIGAGASFAVTDVPAQMAAPALDPGQTDIAVTLAAAPADNGVAIAGYDLRHSTDDATWTFVPDVGAAHDLTGLMSGTGYFVQSRAINGNGAGPWSPSAGATTGSAATAPAQFGGADWALADLASGGDARVTVLDLPDDGGSPLTALEIRIDAGAWVALGGLVEGTYDLTDTFTDGVAAAVELRAVNAEGAGPASAAKSVTTSAGGFDLSETVDGEIELTGSGLFEITVTAPAAYAGTWSVDIADLSAGPVGLVPPALAHDGSPAAGETVTAVPGLWAYGNGGPEPAIALQWQADSGGNGSFADIGGATGTGYALTAAEAGDDIRVVETATQSGTGARSAASAAAGVAAPDTTAPVLSAPAAAATGATTADWSVTSDEGGGTIFAAARPAAASPLTRAEIEAGSGGAAAVSTDATPSAGSANGGSFAGLAAETDYAVDIFQRDASGNDSAVVSSAGFTTGAAGSATATEHTASAAQDYGSGSASSHSFTGLAIGSAQADRTVHVFVGILEFTTSPVPTAVSIGGIAATRAGERVVAGAGNISHWHASVPAGATADITVTAAIRAIGVEVYAAYGRTLGTPVTDSASGNGALVLDVATAGGDDLIGAVLTADCGPMAYSGLTEDHEADIRSTDYLSGASALAVAAASPRAISVSPTGSGQKFGLVVPLS